MFFGPSALQLRSKIDKKASPDRSKIKEKCCQHLDANFDRFGSQLGSILGGFWRPSWTQVGTKWQQTRPHNQSKIWSLLRRPPERILKGFWSQLGSNLDHLGLKTRLGGNVWGWDRGACGRPLYPSLPKTPLLFQSGPFFAIAGHQFQALSIS